MKAYLDTSIVLRIVLNEPEPLQEWSRIEVGYASTLLTVEMRRTFDRLWLRHVLDEDDFLAKLGEANAILNRLEVAKLDETVLGRAAQPFPTVLGTLDAIHLATALHLRASGPATHDRALAAAARAVQFDVLGVAA